MLIFVNKTLGREGFVVTAIKVHKKRYIKKAHKKMIARHTFSPFPSCFSLFNNLEERGSIRYCDTAVEKETVVTTQPVACR